MPLFPKLLGLLLLLGQTMVVQGDDLVTIYQDALLNDRQFSAAQAEREAGLENVIQARAGLLPEVSLQAQNLWNRSQYQVEGGEIEHRRQNQTYSIQLVQPVFRWKSWILYQQGNQQTALAVTRFHGAQQALILRVATAYFEVLSTEEALDALRQQQIADAQLLASARKQFELGNVSIADVHEAQSSADRALAASIKAKSDVQLARHGLARIIGRQPGPLPGLRNGVSLEPPFPSDIDVWIEQAQQSGFEVQHQALLLEIARNEVRSRKADHLPTIDLVASQGMQQRPNVGTERSDSSSIGLRISVPLYGGGRTRSAVRQAQALHEQSEAQYEEAKRTAQLQVREAWLGVVSGMAQVQALETASVSAKSALEANQLGYRVGVRISIDVLQVQSRFTETVQQLSRARYDTLLAKLRLKATVGGLMESDLIELNRLLHLH
ncbi:TolC family outer membrane protein [Pseudomonas fontis]|uniref:TolC family outer membrane protein n=1 Tax=Pseudomonas fontis TaxID=2942633 RepID=A0ABT5NLH7_9PSED|nr:TolC family outer membrane protein [Pseudomonas fontis]MDD0975998.1 TolC family outer membrane protein [Pseudomonas fontis]MDD0989151.1 TolC family outer membrane protein [Pseudomonas fontis]